jgi:hypothetical protein
MSEDVSRETFFPKKRRDVSRETSFLSKTGKETPKKLRICVVLQAVMC